MRKIFVGIAAAALTAGFTVPASAAIFITPDQSASTSENVQYNDGLDTNVNPMEAWTNQGTSVTFTGSENLGVAGGLGQNGGVTGAGDGNIDFLVFQLTDSTTAMSAAQFNIFEVRDVETTVTINAYDQFGDLAATLAGHVLSLDNGNSGQDWFSVTTTDDSLISRIEISTTPSVGRIAQFRLTAADVPTVAVPEPATWAMLIAGFGMVGGAMRLRRREQALAA